MITKLHVKNKKQRKYPWPRAHLDHVPNKVSPVLIFMYLECTR